MLQLSRNVIHLSPIRRDVTTVVTKLLYRYKREEMSREVIMTSKDYALRCTGWMVKPPSTLTNYVNQGEEVRAMRKDDCRHPEADRMWAEDASTGKRIFEACNLCGKVLLNNQAVGVRAMERR